MTVAGSPPPQVARETECEGHISGYLVYESVYDAELILATWETSVGVHLLDLRLAPDFPPPMVVSVTSVPAIPEVTRPGSVPTPPLSRVYGAPYFSQPFAATTPRRITGGEERDAQAVFRAVRVWGPVRTISLVEPEKRPRDGVRTPWSVDVAFWYEEDAERLQREWDVLGGWTA